MPSTNVGFHQIKPRLFYRRLNWGVLPPSVDLRCGSHLVSICAIWSWKISRTRSMRGVTTYVSAPTSNTDCTTALNNKTDICVLAPPCSGSLPLSIKPPPSLSGFGSPLASHHKLQIVLYPGIWRTGQSRGWSYRRWMTLRLPHLPIPPPNTIISALTPSCTALWSCAICLRNSTEPACHIGRNVDGEGLPLPILPQCPGSSYYRSAPTW